MATTKKTKKGAASKNGKKRLTKAELDRQKAIKRMLWTFFFAFVIHLPGKTGLYLLISLRLPPV